ncbi:MAG: response regulator [Lachnospiraceae bacterium]|nr:response regulator [Lachnospiraceae bacterium]
MKYKVLLTGSNKTSMDDFFIHMDESFETLSSSVRYWDMIGHIKYFMPDVFVYCLDRESKEVMSRMVQVKNELSRKGIPFAIVGDVQDCNDFLKTTAGIADIVLQRPMTTKAIESQIVNFLRNLERIAEEANGRKKDAEEGSLDKREGSSALEGAEEVRRKHILVVDDDVRMLRVIKEHLRKSYDVATAINGKLALKFLENKQTDLILLDYVMPEEDGPAVLRKIHDNPDTQDLPVVFLTGMTDRSKIQEALSEKPQGYLLKPIDREKLIDTVEKIIG